MTKSRVWEKRKLVKVFDWPQNDSHERSFHNISSFIFAAVCCMTLFACFFNCLTRYTTKFAYHNNFMSIVKGGQARDFFGPFVSSRILRRYPRDYFHDTHEYYMRWVFHVICFLLLVHQPIEIRGPSTRSAKKAGLQTMNFILYGGIRFIVQFHRCLYCR